MQRDLNIAEEMETSKYYYNLILAAIKDEYENIVTNLLNVKVNNLYLELYKKAVDYSKKSYQETHELYKAGYTTKIDVDNNFAQYRSYQAEMANYLGQKKKSISNLLSEMNWPQGSKINLVNRLKISNNWPLTIKQSIYLAKKQSEKLKNLEIQSQNSLISARSALYEYTPVLSLDINGSVTKSRGEIIKGWPYNSSSYNTDANISLNLEWSIFDGFSSYNSSKGDIKKSQSYQEQQRAEIEKIQSTVASNIDNIKAQLIAYHLNDDAWKARRELTVLTNIGYRSGYNTVFDLISASTAMKTTTGNIF